MSKRFSMCWRRKRTHSEYADGLSTTRNTVGSNKQGSWLVAEAALYLAGRAPILSCRHSVIDWSRAWRWSLTDRYGDDNGTHDVIDLEVTFWTIRMCIVATDAGLGSCEVRIDGLEISGLPNLHEPCVGAIRLR